MSLTMIPAAQKGQASITYFFEGQGAPHGAHAPAKSSGETARPVDALLKC
jgi:hypothetical protein